MPGGRMVYLGGPRRRRSAAGARGIYLHDPPPGYHPPRTRIPLKEQQRKARENYVLMRVVTVVLALSAGAFLVMMLVIIATHI
jgi:hypothetical protein